MKEKAKGHGETGSGRPHSVVGSRANSASFTFASNPIEPPQEKPDAFDLIVYPTIQFFDGRTANRTFLQEMPDPVVMITWDGWVEINPETARELGIKKGDVLSIRAGDREIDMPAFPYEGIRGRTLAVPIGQGHDHAIGRFLSGETDNPAKLLSGLLDPSGGLVVSTRGATISKTGRFIPLANTDGSGYQHDRRLAVSLSYKEYRASGRNSRHHHAPALGLRQGEGFLPILRTRGLPVGHGHRSRPVHRLPGVRGRMLCREQHRHRGKGKYPERTRDVLAPY